MVILNGLIHQGCIPVTCKRAVRGDDWQVELLPKAMKELLTLRGKSDGFEIFEYVIFDKIYFMYI